MLPPAPPNSQLLDRLKRFLPEIAQANEELDRRIREGGAESVRIDVQLERVQNIQDQQSDEIRTQDEVTRADIRVVGEESETQAQSDGEPSDDELETPSQPVIELNFALGDFDDTPIAKIEMSESGNTNGDERIDDIDEQ